MNSKTWRYYESSKVSINHISHPTRDPYYSLVLRLVMTRVHEAEKIFALPSAEGQDKHTLYALNPGDPGYSDTMGAPLHLILHCEDARQLAEQILEMCDRFK